MEAADIINRFVATVSANAMPFATAMAAVGVLTMAILQTVKDVSPVRNIFQRRFLRGWLEAKARDSVELAAGAPNPRQAETDLIRLATAGDRQAFYDLPIEQMCGQINAATQVLFDYPEEHGDLLRCLAALAKPEDLKILLTPRTATEAQRTQAQVDARSRVMHQVQRSIDALQIAAGFRWKLYLQIAAFSLSYLLTIIGLSLYPGTEATTLNNVLVVVLTGIVGGFLAPVARDLVASLERLRG